MVADHQIGRLLWHILDAAGETDIGEKPTLDGAQAIRLSGDDLYNSVAGSAIKTGQFTPKFLQDNHLELWLKDKSIDAGQWRVKKRTGAGPKLIKSITEETDRSYVRPKLIIQLDVLIAVYMSQCSLLF